MRGGRHRVAAQHRAEQSSAAGARPRLSEAALSADRKLVSQAAALPNAEELAQLYLAHGLAELEPSARYDADRQRRLSLFAGELKETERNLLQGAGHRTSHALPAGGKTERRSRGPTGRLSEVPSRAWTRLGGRPWRAPMLSVRAAYKARWNLIHGRPHSEGLSSHRTAGIGGIQGPPRTRLPPQQRAEAARLFYEAGGKRSAEAYGVFLYQGGATRRRVRHCSNRRTCSERASHPQHLAHDVGWRGKRSETTSDARERSRERPLNAKRAVPRTS